MDVVEEDSKLFTKRSVSVNKKLKHTNTSIILCIFIVPLLSFAAGEINEKKNYALKKTEKNT